MNIFVTRLSAGTTDESLNEAFSQFGTVVSAKIIIDRDSGRSKGFGFVEMDDEEEGITAIDEMNEKELDGKTIIVKKANPREERPRDNNRGGGGYGGNRGGYGNDRGNDRGGYGNDRGGNDRGGNNRGGYGNDRRDGGGNDRSY